MGIEYYDRANAPSDTVSCTQMLSESAKAGLLVAARWAEYESVVVDTAESEAAAHLVTVRLEAQPLSSEIAGVALQADQDGASPLLAVRAVTGSSFGLVERDLYVPPASGYLQRLGVATLAEDFPR